MPVIILGLLHVYIGVRLLPDLVTSPGVRIGGALLLVISVSMFGAACVAHDAGHIGLDSVVNRLPPPVRHTIARLVALSTLVFSVVILYGAWEMARSTHDNLIPTLGISEAWRYLPLIIAGALIALFSIDRLLRRMATDDPE